MASILNLLGLPPLPPPPYSTLQLQGGVFLL